MHFHLQPEEFNSSLDRRDMGKDNCIKLPLRREKKEKRVKFDDTRNKREQIYQDLLNLEERKLLWLQSNELLSIRNRLRCTVTELRRRRQLRCFKSAGRGSHKAKPQTNLKDDENDHGEQEDQHCCLRGLEKLYDIETRMRDRRQRRRLTRAILVLQNKKHVYNHGKVYTAVNDFTNQEKLAIISMEYTKFSQLRAENRAFQDETEALKVYKEEFDSGPARHVFAPYEKES